MDLALKIVIFTVIFAIIALMFPHNIFTMLSLPLAEIGDYVQQVGVFIAKLCTFGDLFLIEGQALLMVKSLTLFIIVFIQFKVFYSIVKLLV